MTVPLLADSNSLFVAEEVFTLFAGKVGKINLSKANSMAKAFLASEQMTRPPPPSFLIGDRFLCCGRNVSSGQVA